MKYQLSIIKFPSGKFGFVGSVPKDLAIRHADGSKLSDAEFGRYSKTSCPAMVKKSEGYIEPVFDSKEAAIEFAKKEGFEI